MTRLCVVASYPKSGNTWMRSLLTVCSHPGTPLDINRLVGRNDLVSADYLAGEAAADPAILPIDMLDELRAGIVRHINNGQGDVEFCKTHINNRILPSGRPVFDADSGRAIYVVRHPFDVAVSFAHSTGSSLDNTVGSLLKKDAVLSRPGAGRPRRLPEFMSSWADHVDSWCSSPPLPTMVVRFEDLVANTQHELRRVLSFSGLEFSDDIVALAVDSCRIEKLQGLEAKTGFELSPADDRRFFRSGVPGEGALALTDEERAKLSESGADAMTQLGYLEDGSVSRQWTAMEA